MQSRMADAYTFVYICAFSLQNLPKGAGNVGSLNLSYISKVSPHSSTHTVSPALSVRTNMLKSVKSVVILPCDFSCYQL